MPKNRKTVKLDGVIKHLNVPSKLRIGTRKAGTSASLMSNSTLQDVLTDKGKKRYWNNAQSVLISRGFTVVSA